MSGFTAAGISKDLVSTTQQAPLGFRLTVPNGDKGFQVYTYIKTTVAVTQGQCLMKAGDDYSACLASTTGNGMRAVGVVQQANTQTGTKALLAGDYAFVLTEGYGTVQTGQGSAIGAQLVLYGSGLLTGGTAASATNIPVGHVGAAAVNTAVGTAYVKFLG